VKIPSRINVTLSRVILFVLIFSFVSPGSPLPASAETSYLGDPCHIAIAVVNGTKNYDLSAVGVSSYINFLLNPGPNVASNIEHLKVLKVKDNLYLDQLALIESTVPQNLGRVWLIGNEPDTWHSGQDDVFPETYAERFFQMATRIKEIDTTARVGFGQIVQPSPLRIRYMERVWARLIQSDLAGSPTNALNLIDIFSLHSFILNEQPGGEWGAGIPKGFRDPGQYDDAFIITYYPDTMYKTYDVTIFSQWITAYRQWMKNIGAQNKPLWITEYGSLMPPEDPPGLDYYNVTDEATTDFMLDTFNFIYNTKNPTLGYPTDDNRLVQRAYWYSLNEFRWRFGGALFDPLTGQRTIVGDAFVDYNPPVPPVDQDPYPISITFVPLRYTPGAGLTRVDYRVDVRVGNNVTAENRVPVEVELSLDGSNPPTTLTGYLSRCGGVGIFSFFWNNLEPLVEHTIHAGVTIDTGSGMQDNDPSNNTLDSIVIPQEPPVIFLPVLVR
jgi:hypothetical protein